MSHSHPIVGIDIGSSAIRAIAAELQLPENVFRIRSVVAKDSSGVRRGQVIDTDALSSALDFVLESLERDIGFRPERAAVNISGAHVSTVPSRGVVAVSRADSEISREDVARVLAAAQAVSLGHNREVLHVIPREFIVDGERGLKNTVGMSGVRLEAETILVQVSSPQLRSLERSLAQGGLTADQFVVSGLAAGESALSEKQKELGVLLLDIGAGTTDIAVFEEGECIHIACLPIGSGHITNDIAIGMRTSLDVAERAKTEFGTALLESVAKKDLIKLSELGMQEKDEFSRYELTKIISARTAEIMEFVRKELKRIGRDRLLPAGVIVVGGGAKLKDLPAFIKEALALPVKLGMVGGERELSEELKDPAFATVLGLVAWQVHQGEFGPQSSFFSNMSFKTPKIPSVLKRILKNILP